MTTTYDWREGGPQAAQHNYYRWLARCTLEDTPERREAFEAGFVRGSQWSMQTTSALSPAVASLIAFVDWLRVHEEVAI